MTRTHPSLVGTLLERRYRVDRLLARGGMSAVYRGVDTRLDRQVAIKIMDPRFADDRSFVDRFVREARSAAQLHHPNVVAVHDQGFDVPAGEESGLAFLVMELVDGGTLRDLLAEQGRLDVALALSIAEPVLSALAAAHAAGLVHRDVKPENVLIGRSSGALSGGVVKVGDFGLVRAVASAGTTSSSVILGTVAYLSPEQVTTGAAAARGDVYSTGILLYEMLTGATPYTGDTPLSVAYRHVNDDVPRPSELRPDLPPALDELILRATRRDPEQRPADAGAFLAQLQAVRAELGLQPVPIPVPPPPDGDRMSDAERTMPRIPVAERTIPVSGPQGTRALTRAVPVGPPPSPPTGQQAVAPPPPPPRPRSHARTENAPKPRDRRKMIALVALGVLVLGGLIGAFAFILSESAPTTAAVPKLVGLTQAEAGDKLRAASLTPKYTQEFSNTVPANIVVEVDPAEGTQLEKDATVSVVVSKGRPVVPNIQVGTPLADATKAVQAQQLTLVQGTPAFSDTAPQGTVVSVSPAAGTPVNIGGQVTVVLSKGPEPLPPVPDVTGRPKAEAFQLLQQAGFQPVDGGEEFSQTIPAGGVTRTDPPANSPGSKQVRVFVSNSVQVPDVRFKQFDEAEQILKQAGLDVDKQGGGGGRGHGGGGGFNFVFQQDPQPGSLVPKGTKVKIRGFGG
ncbi:Stk1 family PASTA domain-containing Ser/Thr kinase [Amycolatopsis sp. FDAARGOS 1241]|uniref:Stk1 family PASTA domain-containing Ser/Thr kinase n=1 Tax=Amycolatopsis sp. FDAARGOS 1241 TaxID=2778070 RepID=UPI00194E700F|nr:Stk1 family PASTA domain-containing Ser/Thr kinase [Amycolatopsis sp. FDAARGOS 1241]QRP44138.1 Stk1 family PASTA domain-containing Ser/Thr kinase [Amycolatopsis sp. FDAARGOS 1241]